MGKKRARRDDQENELNESIVINELKSRIAEIEGNVYELQDENVKLNEDLGRIQQDNVILKAEVLRERARVDVLSKNVNNLEQYTRANNIRIFGLDDRDREESNAQTEIKVRRLLSAKLGITIENRDIEACHRLGRFLPSGNRPVIVRFTNRKLKVAAIINRRKLKGTQIVITEDLTQLNHDKLKEIKTLECVNQAWVRDGKLVVKSHTNVIKTIPWDTPCDDSIFESVGHKHPLTHHNNNKNNGSLAHDDPDTRDSSDHEAGDTGTGHVGGRGGQRGGARGGARGGGGRGDGGRGGGGRGGGRGRGSGGGSAPPRDPRLTGGNVGSWSAGDDGDWGLGPHVPGVRLGRGGPTPGGAASDDRVPGDSAAGGLASGGGSPAPGGGRDPGSRGAEGGGNVHEDDARDPTGTDASSDPRSDPFKDNEVRQPKSSTPNNFKLRQQKLNFTYSR